MKGLRITGTVLAIVTTSASLVSAAPCDSLTNLVLEGVTITSAQPVTAGGFTPPEAQLALADLDALPAFCRAQATLTPSSDSDIRVEVWMPQTGWNRRFLGVGNGGWAGSISYGSLANGLRRGYAVAATDTGHRGTSGDASFALGHPEKLTDFAHRAVHEMTVTAKAITSAYFDTPPRYAYWNACSTGGRQGLTEAQRYPEDYDGIVAGAPANYMTHLGVSHMWIAHATLRDPESRLSPDLFEQLNESVLTACDAHDGVRDGVLEDPTRCRLDPQVLECRDGAGAQDCLTAPQVAAIRKVYGPATNPRTNEELFPGLAKGSELEWTGLTGGPDPIVIPVSHFKYVVFEDPTWDWRTLDFDRDVALANERGGALLNAIDPNLRPFVERGGRLILYHGWNDVVISPQNTVNYYEAVASTLGESTVRDSVRLFMAPGMNHCSGGVGPNQFDALGALEEWVENGRSPDRIIASRVMDGEVDRTRPLCPYPQVAQYMGSGDTDDASNFVCALQADER